MYIVKPSPLVCFWDECGGGHALCAALYVGTVEGVNCLLEVLEGVRGVLLCMLEFVERLLESVLEVLEVAEGCAVRCSVCWRS